MGGSSIRDGDSNDPHRNGNLAFVLDFPFDGDEK